VVATGTTPRESRASCSTSPTRTIPFGSGASRSQRPPLGRPADRYRGPGRGGRAEHRDRQPLGGSGRNPTPERQILAGISFTAVLGALVWAVLVTKREAFDRYRHWDVGSLADRETATIVQVMPFIAAGIVLALAMGRQLKALSMGDESATSLGARPARIRFLGMAAITLLCGGATAAAGNSVVFPAGTARGTPSRRRSTGPRTATVSTDAA
jgi:hypothetical protein